MFLPPAIATFVIALLVLIFARETDPFLERRIAYLKLTEEEKEALKAKKSDQTKNPGLLQGLLYAFKDKQLRWLFICTLLYTLARCINDKYTAVLSVVGGLSDSDITRVEFIFPLGVGTITLLYGFFSDKFGRKPVTIAMLSSTIVFFVFFALGSRFGWHVFLLGTFLGLYLGAFWNTGDTYILMATESAPSNLRSSVLSAQTAFYGMGQGLSLAVYALLIAIVGNAHTDFVLLGVSVPMFTLTILFLFLKVKETKGTDLQQLDHEKDAASIEGKE